MPRGAEAEARRFYADGLGMTEVDKPADLAARGGAWFRAFGAGGTVVAEIHVGVEDPFVPARKAHPALVVDDEAALDALAVRLADLGFDVDRRERTSFPRAPALPHVRRSRQPGGGLAPLDVGGETIHLWLTDATHRRSAVRRDPLSGDPIAAAGRSGAG